jgi:hypothetical protein
MSQQRGLDEFNIRSKAGQAGGERQADQLPGFRDSSISAFTSQFAAFGTNSAKNVDHQLMGRFPTD